jgi:hypothetical protein
VEHSFQREIPSGFTFDFDSGIFHQKQHLLLQSPEGWRTYTLLNNARKTVEGIVHYHINSEGEAKSPYRSPYGSYIFSERVSEKLLSEFVEFTECKLREEAVQRVSLKNPPEVYTPQQSALLNKVLLKSGYTIETVETSAVISIRDHSFDTILHRSRKSRLKKCHDQRFSFMSWPLSRVPEVYDFINACRSEKGYTLSMSMIDLQHVVNAFPNVFLLHVVMDGNHLVAASISIHVTKNVLYTFYYDHAKKYDAVSPVVFLCEGLFNYCRQGKIDLLDLGTANIGGKPNLPLLNFKLSLGAQPSRKLTFVKNLS